MKELIEVAASLVGDSGSADDSGYVAGIVDLVSEMLGIPKDGTRYVEQMIYAKRRELF